MGKSEMSGLDWVSFILLVVGGLNWGLVGIGVFANTNLNLVNLIFGSIPTLEAIVYLLVGLAALYALLKTFSKKSAKAAPSK